MFFSFGRRCADGNGAGEGAAERRCKWLQFQHLLARFWHFEPSLDALSLQSNVIGSMKIISFSFYSTEDVLAATVRVRVLPHEELNGSNSSIFWRDSGISSPV